MPLTSPPCPARHWDIFATQVVVVLTTLTAVCQGDTAKLGVIHIATASENFSFCLKYFPSFKMLPQDKSEAAARQVVNMAVQDACLPLHRINLTDKVALIRDVGRCPLETVAQNFLDVKAYAVIVGLSANKLDDIVYDRQTSQPLDIVMGFVNRRSIGKLMKLLTPKEPLLSQLFTMEPEFDKGLIIVWSIATLSVAVGAFWAGHVSHQLYRYHAFKARHAAPSAGEAEEVVKKPEEIDMEEDVDVQITPTYIIFFVGFMCCSLIVIYIFIQYVVYLIIGMFVLASSVAVIGVLEPFFYKVPIGTTRLPNYAFPCFYGSLEVRQVFLVVFSVCLSFSWVVIRNDSKAWLLQDFLGVLFSIYMIKTLRMPNLRVVGILLVLLFFYDIFFVFITPYLIPKTMPHNQTGSFAKSSGYGDSIMVEVARGGGSQEQIPMVMRVPHFSNEDIAVCFGQYSVLGFGDILIPGFLVAYVHSFDLIVTQGRLYYVTSLVAYGVGLVVTFVGLYVMKIAQPALLYLVPATLIPVIGIAWYRGELRDIWYGIKLITPSPSEEEPEPPADTVKRKRSSDEEDQRREPASGPASEPPPPQVTAPSRSALFPAQPFPAPAWAMAPARTGFPPPYVPATAPAWAMTPARTGFPPPYVPATLFSAAPQ